MRYREINSAEPKEVNAIQWKGSSGELLAWATDNECQFLLFKPHLLREKRTVTLLSNPMQVVTAVYTDYVVRLPSGTLTIMSEKDFESAYYKVD